MQKVELTRLDRRKVKILEKRAAFLKKRIDSSPNKDLSFDKAELGALRWAIAQIVGDGEVEI